MPSCPSPTPLSQELYPDDDEISGIRERLHCILSGNMVTYGLGDRVPIMSAGRRTFLRHLPGGAGFVLSTEAEGPINPYNCIPLGRDAISSSRILEKMLQTVQRQGYEIILEKKSEVG